MKIDKTKLIQDIEDMKQKLASMEQELNKPDVFKHFPSKGDTYYVLCSNGNTLRLIANDSFLVNTYKTKEEAEKTYKKFVALEKIKRRLLELQGDWIPNWKDSNAKHIILYSYDNNRFEYDLWKRTKYPSLIPYIKTSDIVNTILNEMQDELKVIYDIT